MKLAENQRQDSLPQRVLLGVTGSIAAFKAAQLASELVQAGCQVQVVTTPSALQFVGESTWEGLTNKPVFKDLFAPGRAMDHIELAKWADAFLVYPCSAHTLNALSAGLAEGPLGNLFLAWSFLKPMLIAPAMNSQMWQHPSTQNSLKTLHQMGAIFLPPTSGSLACGDVGVGRLHEPSSARHWLSHHCNAKSLQKKPKLLITGGGTSEAIDAVRTISNNSTGTTAAHLAEVFFDAGFEVDLLMAARAIGCSAPVPQRTFTSHAELSTLLQEQLSQNSYDFVIHAAAVSDFKLSPLYDLRSKKISSSNPIDLKLEPTAKLLDALKDWSRNPKIQIVAFKLTVNADESEKIKQQQKLSTAPGVRWIVSNDLSQLSATQHGGEVLDVSLSERFTFETNEHLGMVLKTLLKKNLPTVWGSDTNLSNLMGRLL